ncbi:MAG: hypothetical protein K9K40_00375 [Desulfotignum sp.]|nr:hypothetical protein [Desulfotignum sp.]
MKCIQADYDDASQKFFIAKNAKIEDWAAVCRRFNDDVERVGDISDQNDYTGVYVCNDDTGTKVFYLVREDKALFRMKRRHFFDKIGLT